MAELLEHMNRLQQENERLRTRLETNRGDNSKGSVHPASQPQPNKGKEPILMGESDPRQTMNYLPAALCSLPAHHPRITQRLSLKKAPTPI